MNRLRLWLFALACAIQANASAAAAVPDSCSRLGELISRDSEPDYAMLATLKERCATDMSIAPGVRLRERLAEVDVPAQLAAIHAERLDERRRLVKAASSVLADFNAVSDAAKIQFSDDYFAGKTSHLSKLIVRSDMLAASTFVDHLHGEISSLYRLAQELGADGLSNTLTTTIRGYAVRSDKKVADIDASLKASLDAGKSVIQRLRGSVTTAVAARAHEEILSGLAPTILELRSADAGTKFFTTAMVGRHLDQATIKIASGRQQSAEAHLAFLEHRMAGFTAALPARIKKTLEAGDLGELQSKIAQLRTFSQGLDDAESLRRLQKYIAFRSGGYFSLRAACEKRFPLQSGVLSKLDGQLQGMDKPEASGTDPRIRLYAAAALADRVDIAVELCEARE